MRRRYLTDFARDSSGSVFVYTAAAAAVMLGFVGLAMDVSFWYSGKRDMQSAADAGAMTAALEMARGATAAELESRTKALILANGYAAGDVTINTPPLTGDYAGNANFVEVIVAQPQSGFVSGIFHSEDMPVQARAVATLAGGPACLIALDPTEDQTLSVEGQATVSLQCGAQANSTSDTALSQQGVNSSLSASNISTGGATYEGSNYTPDPATDMAPAGDPFAYLVAPALGPCLEPAGVPKNYPGGSGTIPAGHYCGGLVIEGGTWDFEPGLYSFDEAGLHITSLSTITGDDVTFYILPTVTGIDQGIGYGNSALYIAGQATVELSAPTTGQWQGVLFYVDQALDPALSVVLAGGSDMSLEGVVYASQQEVYFAGGSATNSATWTTVIGDEVHFVGDSFMASGAFTGGNLPVALTSPSLAE